MKHEQRSMRRKEEFEWGRKTKPPHEQQLSNHVTLCQMKSSNKVVLCVPF